MGLEAGAAPAITSISPESGTNYSQVTITGTGFGASRGTSTVTFAGTEASRYHQWSDTEIEVSPPTSLAYGAGAVVVTVGGAASNGATYTRLGVLTAFCAVGGGGLSEPSGTFDVGVHRSGPAAEAVTVALSYRGRATHGADYTAPESLALAAGERTKTGTLTVVDDAGREGPEQIVYQVSAEGYLADSCALTLGDDDPEGAPAPWIGGLDPTLGGAGVGVSVTGLSFGAAKGTSTVTFSGREAATTAWSETAIRAVVPAGAATGRVLVTVGGQVSNGVGFTVTAAPSIGGIDPVSGVPGTGVEITGMNFGATKRFSTVAFNGREAVTTAWSETAIRAVVPEGAVTGEVVVTVGGVVSNGVGFTVIGPLRLGCPSSVSEPSGTGGVTARVDSGYEPPAEVTFAVAYGGTASRGTDYREGTLTMGAGQRSGRMDPRLRVIDDSLPEGEETIELTVSAAGYQEAGCTIRLVDDEPWIGGLEPAAGPVGASVAIAGVNFGAVKGTSSVTFNGSAGATTSWSATSITATVPAGATTGNVVVTVGGKASNGAPFTVTGVSIDPTEMTVEEGGTGTYTVVLDSKPASAVTVSMFAPGGTDLSVDILPVFTASNWDDPQTVTVTAGEDDDRADDSDTIVHRTASADRSYQDLSVDSLVVTVTDNDAGAGVRVDPVELTVEEGTEETYTVVLNTAPSADVMVAVTAGEDLTVSPASLTFTAGDWSTVQTVRVTAGEDDDAEDETETIAHAVTSTDAAYNGLAVEEVKVIVADDEGTGGPGGTEELTVSTTRLRITEGNMGKYTVVLNRAPAAGVAVAVAAPSGSDLAVSPARLDFTPSNWDTPQQVMVAAGEDSDLLDEVESITHTIRRAAAGSSSSLRGGLWRNAAFATAMASPAPTREYVYLGGRLAAITEGGAVGEVSVVVTIDDDDDPETPGVPAMTDSLRLTEGHTGAYTLELGAAPTADVAIALSVDRGADNAADVTVRPTSVTFSASDWDAPQWITVSVGYDSDTVGETEIISHAATSTDSRYQGIGIPPVRVVIRDRNRAAPPGDPTRPPDRPEGTLTASPRPCTIAVGQTTCSTTLNWTSRNTTAVQIRRTEPSNNRVNEIVVRSGIPNGQYTYSGIGLTASTFTLYDYSDGSRGLPLAPSVTVRGVPLSLSPDSGPVGTSVTIMGSGFGSNQGTVNFGRTPVTPAGWNDTRIVFEVPENATLGAKTVSVTASGLSSRTVGTFTVTENVPPITCSADPEIVDPGGMSTLRWMTNGATGVRIDPGIGTVTPVAGGARKVSLTTTTTYTFTATLEAGGSAICMATVKVRPGATFTADPAAIASGQSSTLRWTTTNATGASIDQGIGTVTPVAGGSKNVSPTVTTTYTLTATNADASVTKTVTVKVGPGVTFTADPAAIASGQSSTLRWTTTNATGVSIDQGIGTVTPVAGGSKNVSPTVTTTYTLTATNADASTTRTAKVTVTQPSRPVISSLSPSQGVPDSQVTVHGSNFGTTEDTVSFGGSSAEIEDWSDTEIDVLVPRHLSRGTVSVTVTANGLTSTGVNFRVTGDPVRRNPEEECENPKDCPEEEDEKESTPDP